MAGQKKTKLEDPRSPWTHEELETMKARLDASITQTEREHPNIRPLPPMTEDESKGLILRLGETAARRPLTPDEVFLHGQLLANFRIAVQAKTLGYSGRYFVISAEEIERLGKA